MAQTMIGVTGGSGVHEMSGLKRLGMTGVVSISACARPSAPENRDPALVAGRVR